MDPQAGALITKYIDSVMNDKDRLNLADLFRKPEHGSSREWLNKTTGYRFLAVAVKRWTTKKGPCYEFILDARRGSETEYDVFGTACQLGEALWLVS
jgi:hypothetical protein